LTRELRRAWIKGWQKDGGARRSRVMYIADYMTTDPVTIFTDTPIPYARRLMSEHGIRHLPVIDRQRKLIGIVTDRDLRSAYPSSVASRSEKIVSYEQVERATVAEIMTTDCATLKPESTIDDALLLFDGRKVGGIPVVNEMDEVIGIFSLLDLTAAYKDLFGVAEEQSILLGVEDDGRDNILGKLVTLLAQNDVRLTRLLRLDDDEDNARIYMRVNASDPLDVVRLLQAEDYMVIHCR
jgi:acetoin utilization protein AcuB